MTNINTSGNINNVYSPEYLPQQAGSAQYYSVPQYENDSVELSQNADKSQDKNSGVKKFLISLGLTVATIAGLAFIGNKTTNLTAKAGLKVDKFLKGNKLYNSVSGGLKKAKTSVKDFVLKHSATARDISETLANRHAKSKLSITRGYGQGMSSITSNTVTDVLGKSFKKETSSLSELTSASKNVDKLRNQLKQIKPNSKKWNTVKTQLVESEKALSELCKKSGASSFEEAKKIKMQSVVDAMTELVGNKDGGKAAKELSEYVAGLSGKGKTSSEVADILTSSIAEHFNCGNDKEKLLKVLTGIKDGSLQGADVEKFRNILMKGDLISSWWPVNFLNKVVSKVTGKPSSFGRGNLGDALIKYNVSKGTLADTALGKIVQNSIFVPTECVSSFVNDKSGLGVLLGMNVFNLFNSVQEAPKEQKVATVADDTVNSIAALTLATPLAFKATYGAASLANLKGNGFFSKLLKKVGGLFGMGLDKFASDGSKIVNKNKLKGFLGGGLRFAAIMFVLTPLIQKPIQKLTHKIFGKPYEGSAQSTQQGQNIQYTEEELNQLYQQYMQDPQYAELFNSLQNQNNIELQQQPSQIPVQLQEPEYIPEVFKKF